MRKNGKREPQTTSLSKRAKKKRKESAPPKVILKTTREFRLFGEEIECGWVGFGFNLNHFLHRYDGIDGNPHRVSQDIFEKWRDIYINVRGVSRYNCDSNYRDLRKRNRKKSKVPDDNIIKVLYRAELRFGDASINLGSKHRTSASAAAALDLAHLLLHGSDVANDVKPCSDRRSIRVLSHREAYIGLRASGASTVRSGGHRVDPWFRSSRGYGNSSFDGSTWFTETRKEEFRVHVKDALTAVGGQDDLLTEILCGFDPVPKDQKTRKSSPVSPVVRNSKPAAKKPEEEGESDVEMEAQLYTRDINTLLYENHHGIFLSGIDDDEGTLYWSHDSCADPSESRLELLPEKKESEDTTQNVKIEVIINKSKKPSRSPPARKRKRPKERLPRMLSNIIDANSDLLRRKSTRVMSSSSSSLGSRKRSKGVTPCLPTSSSLAKTARNDVPVRLSPRSFYCLPNVPIRNSMPSTSEPGKRRSPSASHSNKATLPIKLEEDTDQQLFYSTTHNENVSSSSASLPTTTKYKYGTDDEDLGGEGASSKWTPQRNSPHVFSTTLDDDIDEIIDVTGDNDGFPNPAVFVDKEHDPYEGNSIENKCDPLTFLNQGGRDFPANLRPEATGKSDDQGSVFILDRGYDLDDGLSIEPSTIDDYKCKSRSGLDGKDANDVIDNRENNKIDTTKMSAPFVATDTSKNVSLDSINSAQGTIVRSTPALNSLLDDKLSCFKNNIQGTRSNTPMNEGVVTPPSPILGHISRPVPNNRKEPDKQNPSTTLKCPENEVEKFNLRVETNPIADCSFEPPPTLRRRCNKCANCLRKDCGRCEFCLDKVKFGRFNERKRACIHRRCIMMSKSESALDDDQNSSSPISSNEGNNDNGEGASSQDKFEVPLKTSGEEGEQDQNEAQLSSDERDLNDLKAPASEDVDVSFSIQATHSLAFAPRIVFSHVSETHGRHKARFIDL